MTRAWERVGEKASANLCVLRGDCSSAKSSTAEVRSAAEPQPNQKRMFLAKPQRSQRKLAEKQGSAALLRRRRTAKGSSTAPWTFARGSEKMPFQEKTFPRRGAATEGRPYIDSLTTRSNCKVSLVERLYSSATTKLTCPCHGATKALRTGAGIGVPLSASQRIPFNSSKSARS